MRLIDLSRDIEHKMQRLPNHPMVSISYFTTHEEKREADGYMFSSAVTLLNMGDHSGTHVDAPLHFDERPGAKGIDEMPLENFFTEAVCLDLSHKELKTELNQAAKAAITHDPELRTYAERKLKYKAYPLVLNNVKFKLILRMFSLIKRGEMFVDNYRKVA